MNCTYSSMVSTPSCGRGGCGSINVKHNYACIPDCKCTRGYISLVQWHCCKSGQWWRSAWQNKKKQTTYFAHLAHSYDIALYNEDYSYYLIMGRDTKKRTTHYSHLCCNCKNIRVLRHYFFTDGTKTLKWLNGWKMNNWIASLSIKFIRKEMTT